MRCPLRRSSGGRAGVGRQEGRPGCCCPGGAAGERPRRSAPARGGGGCGGDASRAAQPGSAGLAGARRPAREKGMEPARRGDSPGCAGLGQRRGRSPGARRERSPPAASPPRRPGAPRAGLAPGTGGHLASGSAVRAPSHPDRLLSSAEGAKYFTLQGVCALWFAESLKNSVSVSSC